MNPDIGLGARRYGYGFGGAMLLFRSERLSEDVLAAAGAGEFGFDVFPADEHHDRASELLHRNWRYWERGATTLKGHPLLVNGFMVRAGARFYRCWRSAC